MNKGRLILLILASCLCLCGLGRAQEIDEKLGSPAALDVVLRDELGNPVKLQPLVDKPTILTLNYFRCAGICTPLLHNLASALNSVELTPGRDFQVITVSFDPTDTPEVAHQKQTDYLGEMQRPFPPQAWRFLTGEASATRKLADSVGFQYHAQGDQYVHPGAIMILTPKGVVSRYIYGISFLAADLQIALQDASASQVRPSISRLAAVCYSYDPTSRTYVFSMTRTVATATLLLAGAFVLYLVLGRRRRSDGSGRSAGSVR
jgi:protein SCO1/2